MDDKSQTIQPISEDQELAKVLAGMSDDYKIEESAEAALPQEDAESPKTDNATGSPGDSVEIIEEESTLPEPNNLNSDTPGTLPAISANMPSVFNMPEVKSVATSSSPESAPAGDSNLESIKKDALLELRPLMNKLDLSPDEKFDICLLLLRSTDDKTLIEPAHNAAREIADETKRAQALLDIIKEIDYLSGPTQPVV